MKIHELKTWPIYFDAIAEGVKTFEWRKNDRDYFAGDFLILKEWSPDDEEYTGREIKVFVPYLLRMSDDSVIMSIEVKEMNL